MNEEINRKHQEETDKIYRSYGRFAIEFEQLCNSLRSCILFHLQHYGLTEQYLTRIMLTDLTAYQLISKLRSITSFVYKDKPEIIKHLDPYYKAILKINEQRNFMIHGTWYVKEINEHNIKSNHKFDKVLGVKNKITKDGVNNEQVKFSENEFNELSDKILIAKKLTHLIHFSLTYDGDIIEYLKKQEIDKLM